MTSSAQREETPATRAGAGRVPELDGLRGVAILLVVFSHAVNGVFPSYRGLAPQMHSLGGFVGVQLFLVLSGFLITGVLLKRRGLGRFYLRRVRRLYPTLVVVTLVALAWTWDAGGTVRALTYTENIPAIVEATGGGGWMGHTWSLAVEEQFYLAWPVLLLVSGRHAAKVATAGIVLTVVAQQVVGWSESAVYSGLRWDAVLAGCMLTLMGWRGSPRLFAVGAVVLGWYTLGMSGPLEPHDYPVATFASFLVVASAGSVRGLASGWLRHIGHISYAWYLWHVLVMRLDVAMPVAMLLGFVLAEITYLLIDRRAQLTTPQRGVVAPSLRGTAL